MGDSEVIGGEERRGNDERFKREILGRLEKIDRTLFDEDGNSNIRIISTRQIDLHNENTKRLGHLERAMFNEKGESRMLILEAGQGEIKELLGKGRFLTAIAVGFFALIAPLATLFITWFRK